MTAPASRSTRTPEECQALADRQRGGEDLGFSDAFVKAWASPGGAGKSKAPPAKAEPKAEAKAEPKAEAKAEPKAAAKADPKAKADTKSKSKSK